MGHSRSFKYILAGAIGLAVLTALMVSAGNSRPALAQENPTATPEPTPTAEMPAQPGSGHADCMNCHSNPRMMGKFTNGETISLFYDESKHAGSIHAERGLGCRACHVEQTEYPHSISSENSCSVCHFQLMGGTEPSKDAELVFDIPLESPRSMSLHLSQACKRCHESQGQEVTGSDHERIMENGNPFAPVCLDCHGSHDVGAVSSADSPQVCSKCHQAVYTAYKSSVHGEALENDANTDVPTCGNCHGTHVVRGPVEPTFRADSIELCGSCHADEQLMGKYGISTNVFNTYVDDFHGRSVEFSRQSQTKVDKATCYDCHGVHNILPPSDEDSTVYPANLQRTCQNCHRDADITFPEAWLSHRVPDWTDAPVVYAVNVAYIILIPAVIGGMVLYVIIDAYHRIKTRKKNHDD